MSEKQVVNLSLWASGNGSNVENIINYFADNRHINVAQIIVSRPDAYVIRRAIKHEVPYHVISREQMNDLNYIVPLLYNAHIDLIALAGFLWKIPPFLLDAYPDRILNIHPALLPDYGGKGMYGDKVHRAILKNKESHSGISIHYVNAQYDEGNIILQKKIDITADESLDSLKKKIHALEYEYYPIAIEKIAQNILDQ